MKSLLVLSDPSARIVLVSIWYGFFILNLSIILYLYLDQWIEIEALHDSLKQINSIYAPYVGAITIFYFSNFKKGKTGKSNDTGISFFVALICTFLWNCIILMILVPLLFKTGTIEDSLKNIEFIGGLFSWLVACSIGYYFANPTSIK